MSSVAKSLDILQGEKNAYMGSLLPTLTMCLRKLEKSKSKNAICDALANPLIENIKLRFSSQLGDQKMVMAACINPCFKLTWLNVDKHEQVKEDILTELREGSAMAEDATNCPSSSNNEEEDDFFAKDPKTKAV